MMLVNNEVKIRQVMSLLTLPERRRNLDIKKFSNGAKKRDSWDTPIV